MMSTTLYITAIWFAVVLASLGIEKFQKLSFPKLTQRHNILLLTLEILAIIIAIYFNNETNSSYILITASFLLLVGWIKSHQNLLLRIFRGTKKRTWLWRINSLLEGSKQTQNIYFLGDWLQIVAIALIWNSFYSLLISCIAYPITVLILSSINTKKFNQRLADRSEFVQNEVWVIFTKSVLRSLIIALLPLIPYAIANRNLTLFFGSLQDALNLITTLAQVETTVLALVITFLFVLVEFTNAAYSPRLVTSFVRQWSFKLMVALASLSITLKFLLMANASRYISLSDKAAESILIDWALVLTILSVFGYFIFIRDIVSLMQPETIAYQILTKFDEDWMRIVRKNWADRNRQEKLVYSDEDPMILFERYLASTVERGDIYSTKIALIMMRDKISQITNQDDGAIMDSYLFSRLGNVVDSLANNHSDLGLEILCEGIGEITSPSKTVIKTGDVGMFDPLPGTQLLRKIAEKAIDFDLINSGRRAIHLINDRAESTVRSLPEYKELWIINEENHNLPHPETEKLWKNDWRLDNYIEGHHSYFAKLGERAIKQKSTELVWSITNSIISQINMVPKVIKEENYQRNIIINALFSLDKIVSSACSEKLYGSIYFGLISYGELKDIHHSIAQMIVNYFSKFIEKIARAGILDARIVIDVALLAFNLKLKYPELAIQLIDTFGNVGAIIVKEHDFLSKENREYVLYEINQRIDQIRPLTSDKKLNAKISKTVNAAKRKLKKNVVS